MEKRGRTTTSSLLQKVSSQLKGERVTTQPKEEDELTAYLNSLTKKTSQHAKSINFSDYGDISISSSDNLSTPKNKAPVIGAGSKFLKKKKVEETEDPPPTTKTQPKKEATKQGVSTTRTALASNKESSKSAVFSNLNLSIDTDTEEVGGQNVNRLTLPETPSEKSVGRDGLRFMKRSESPGIKEVKTSSEKNKKRADKAEKKKKNQNVFLSSDESLADFMHRLSSSDSTPVLKPARKHQRPADGAPPIPRSPSPEAKPKRYTTPSPRTPRKSLGSPKRRSPSPYALNTRSRSQDSDMVDSIVSEVVDSPDGVTSEEMFKVVMDIDALEPALQTDTKKTTRTSRGRDKTNRDKKTTQREKKTKSSSKTSKTEDLFSSFGLQTVEDLMGNISDEKEESIASEISEVKFVRQDSYPNTPRKDSVSEIKTFGSGVVKRKQVSLARNQESEASISERIGESSRREKSSAASEVKTQYSDETEEDYTEFESITESVSLSPRRPKKSVRYDEDEERSYSDSYTSYTDSKTYTKSYTQSSRPPSAAKRRPATRNMSVQTGEEPGLSYSWKTPMAALGPSYGLEFVDPSPIATHVISPDALEAMTAYSPAMIALHDMLKQQLTLTQSFLAAQERIYKSYSSTLESNYHYTTLEDTKEYIKKHRKPTLTFKQALKMVSAEMNN